MLKLLRKFVAAAAVGAGIASLPNVASALPMLDPLTIKNAAPPAVEPVQWRGGWGWGAPVAAGVVAGAVVGSAVAASAYGPYYPAPYYYPPPAPAYGYPPYPAPAPAYGYPPPAAGPAGGYPQQAPGTSGQSAGDPVAYCMQRYRSYNPQTGTYLGTDGQRHPCP